jgi:5-methyltetrahydrofolate--homocysteine methyltransferase
LTLTERIRAGVLLLDGAMGTELQSAGLATGETGDWWNVAYPERVTRVHDAYRDAGADVLTTNSFGAHRRALARYGFADRVADVNRAAAHLARRAIREGQFVLGAIGPSGPLFDPRDDGRLAELRDEYRLRAAALLEGGADGVLIETMTDLREAAAAVEAARDAGAPLVAATMSFTRFADGSLRAVTGAWPGDAARALRDAGADIVGANCGTAMALPDFALVAAQMRLAAPGPVVVQPNAGEPVWRQGKAVYGLEPADFAEGMLVVLDAGAAIVGGCCGTTPAHIAALRRELDGRTSDAGR